MSTKDTDRHTNDRENDHAGIVFIRTHERWRTVRLAVICLSVIAGLWIVADAVVQIVEKPAWVTLVLGVLAAIFALPSFVIWRQRVKFRTYISTDHQRVIELEAKLDKERSSSGLTDRGDEPENEP